MAASTYLNLDLSFNRAAIMATAHAAARASVADAARRGKVRRYRIALRDALPDVWISARTEREFAGRAADLAAMPAAKAAVVVSLRDEALCARHIDSLPAYLAAMASVEARAAAVGVRL